MKENLAKEWGLLPRSLPYDWKMEGGIAGCDLYTRRALRAFEVEEQKRERKRRRAALTKQGAGDKENER